MLTPSVHTIGVLPTAHEPAATGRFGGSGEARGRADRGRGAARGGSIARRFAPALAGSGASGAAGSLRRRES